MFLALRLMQLLAALYHRIIESPLEPILHPSARRIQWLGLLTFIGHPLYWWLWSGVVVQPYENLTFRGMASMLGLVLMLPWINRDPSGRRTAIAFVAISWVVLPLFFSWMYLCNGGNAVWMASFSAMILVWYHVTDWRLATVGLLLSACVAWPMFRWFGPDAPLPAADLLMTNVAVVGFAWSIALLLGVLAANARQFQIERAAALEVLAASIAHEMRNPLGQIKYSLAGIAQALPPPTTTHTASSISARSIDELFHHVALGEMAIHRGLQVITMILDEVKAKAIDTSRFVYVPAGKAAKLAVEEYGYEMRDEADKVRLDVVRDFVFKGDETLFLFILFNLIKNALYYFKARPTATLTITVDAPTITLTDTGPGISPERLPHLFQPFQTSGKSGGTGLGLSYCKRIMLAFGGDITCDSVVEQYTRFTLRFPELLAADHESQEQIVLSQARSRLQGKRILVADDDNALRRRTVNTLHELGTVVDEADNGQTALNILAQTHFDVVILDLRMPVMDGYATAQAIRAGEAGRNAIVAILAYSSEPGSQAQAKAKRSGIDAFVHKYGSAAELVGALVRVLDRDPCARMPPESVTLANMTVLVADDSDFNRSITKKVLQGWEVEVIEAGHGYAVLDQLERHPHVDVILMDVQMPELDGLTATKLIRASQGLHRLVPILAMTGYSDDRHLRAATEAGMSGSLTKPVDADALRLALLRFAPSAQPRTLSDSPDVPAARANAATLGDDAPIPLLNMARLREYRLLGILGDDVPDHVQRAGILMQMLHECVSAQHLRGAQEALHSLLGLYGLAGSLALHAFIREVYRDVIQGRWPDNANWLTRLDDLCRLTDEALQAYYSEHGIVGRPVAQSRLSSG